MLNAMKQKKKERKREYTKISLTLKNYNQQLNRKKEKKATLDCNTVETIKLSITYLHPKLRAL